MRVDELGTRVWPVELRGSTLVVGGLELNLDGLADQGVIHVLVYADGEGRPTLEATPWLGAEVGLPSREYELVETEAVGPDGEAVTVAEARPRPLNLELVWVRLFHIQGGEA